MPNIDAIKAEVTRVAGEPWPGPVLSQLPSDIPGVEDYITRLKALAEQRGYVIVGFAQGEENFHHMQALTATMNGSGSLMGMTDLRKKRITINQELPRVAYFYVLTHELAHVLAKHPPVKPTNFDQLAFVILRVPPQADFDHEAEAELAVYFTFQGLGLPTRVSEVYLAGKSHSDPLDFLSKLDQAAEKSTAIATELLMVLKGGIREQAAA
jgi:hypothetical protein